MRRSIFIGYRRADTGDIVGRVYDALCYAFSEREVFRDIDSIPMGAEFAKHIRSLLPKCRVFLAFIGPDWLNARDEHGQRRLDNPDDLVRVEIAIALATPRLLVVPVLVNGARMPGEHELPADIGALASRHAAIMRGDPDFRNDISRLVDALRDHLRTGRLNLQSLGGAAQVTANAAGGSALVLAAWLAFAGVGAVSTTVPQIREPIVSAAVSVIDSVRAPPSQAEVERPAGGDDDGAAEAERRRLSEAELEAERLRLAEAERQRLEIAERERLAEQQRQQLRAALPEMVRIPGRNFEVGRFEVTFTQWDACVAGGGCNGYRPDDRGWGRGNRPVINVSWNDAQAYVQWLSQRTGQRYRLPTSAEWEVAARAGTTTEYSWGDQAPVCDQSARNGANFDPCTDDRTRPVGSFQPNAYGLYDVHGNVWEWVEDCYDSSCSVRVLRGGSWSYGPEFLRSANRDRSYPTFRSGLNCCFGFRVARTV